MASRPRAQKVRSREHLLICVCWTALRRTIATGRNAGGGPIGHESRSNVNRTPARMGGPPPTFRHYSPSTRRSFTPPHTHFAQPAHLPYVLVGLDSPRISLIVAYRAEPLSCNGTVSPMRPKRYDIVPFLAYDLVNDR
jgi:hypothetical protein